MKTDISKAQKVETVVNRLGGVSDLIHPRGGFRFTDKLSEIYCKPGESWRKCRSHQAGRT